MRRHSTYERVMLSGLVFIGLFLSLSLLKAVFDPEIRVEGERVIQAPIERIWQLITEDDKRILWETGIVSIVPLEIREFGEGSRSLLIYSLDGRAFDVEERISELESMKRLEAERDGDDFDGHWSIRIESDGGGGALVSVTETRHPKHFYLRWMAPWVQWRDARRLERALRNLEELAVADK